MIGLVVLVIVGGLVFTAAMRREDAPWVVIVGGLGLALIPVATLIVTVLA